MEPTPPTFLRALISIDYSQVKMNFGDWFIDGNLFMKSGVLIDARYVHLNTTYEIVYIAEYKV